MSQPLIKCLEGFHTEMGKLFQSLQKAQSVAEMHEISPSWKELISRLDEDEVEETMNKLESLFTEADYYLGNDVGTDPHHG